MLKDEMVEVRTNGRGLKHYQDLGYKPENNKPFLVKSSDLTPTSEIKVKRICDCCGCEDMITFKKYKPICHKCYLSNRWVDAEYARFTQCVDCGDKCQIKADKNKEDVTRCKSCHSKFMIGKNNPNYGNGAKISGKNNVNFGKRGKECSWYKTELSEEDRLSNRQGSEHVAWRLAVYKAFDFKCDCCDVLTTGGTCEAHHLESYGSNPHLRLSVSNGVCLCKNCHTIFHKTYGFGNNTKEQYLAFKESYK